MVRDCISISVIFSIMENQKNYFDKFVEDLARREEAQAERNRMLQKAQEMWQKRHDLQAKYREHAQQRIRYDR